MTNMKTSSLLLLTINEHYYNENVLFFNKLKKIKQDFDISMRGSCELLYFVRGWPTEAERRSRTKTAARHAPRLRVTQWKQTSRLVDFPSVCVCLSVCVSSFRQQCRYSTHSLYWQLGLRRDAHASRQGQKFLWVTLPAAKLSRYAQPSSVRKPAYS